MSFNRENVVWRSPNGTWNRGYYTSFPIGDTMDDDYDPEWDVDYDMGSFENYRGGFAMVSDAFNYEPMGNPGGGTVVGTDEVERIAELEKIATSWANQKWRRRYR